MKKRMISVLLALVMALCVGIPAAGAITSDEMANAPELALGETTVTIETGGQYAYFKLVPEYSCQYTFYSTGNFDTVVYLYNAEGSQTATSDDDGENYNFKLVVTLTAGETYYLGARIWGSSNTGSYPLYSEVHNISEWMTVIEPTCTEPGEETGVCTLCEETVTREIAPLGHDWGAAASNNNGTHTHTCNRCSLTETEPCIYDTQTQDGFDWKICEFCGYSTTEEAAGTKRLAYWNFEQEPDDWTFVDADGDGYTWFWHENGSAFEGDYTIRSYSYYSSALTPDNWAISPAFSLIAMSDAKLSLMASGRANSSYCHEVFAIYAGISPDPEQMVKISDDIVTEGEYDNATADLSDFAGLPNVYIAIRHYNCSDQYELDVDCVEVTGTAIECSNHVLKAVPAGEANCTVGAHIIAFYQCENCSRMFLDAEGQQPTRASEVFNSPALGHDWGEAVSNEDGTHTYTCSRCNETMTKDCTFETVTENGVVADVCTECGYTRSAPIIALWDFEKEPTDWWFYDADGDSFTWYWTYDEGWTCNNGSGMIHSASYINNFGALTPDNFAVSPAFSLVGVEDATLSAWARGQDSSYYSEVFAIYAGTTRNPSDWIKVSEDYTTTGAYQEYTADLSAFVGEPVVHIAIRHYDVTDMYWLNIDDVSISGTRVEPCATGSHTMTYVPAKEPTETEDGNIAYYVCDVCGWYYLDEEGTQPVSASNVIIPGGYPVIIDSGMEYGTVASLVSRAKEEECVPLTILPDLGAELERLAYIDGGAETMIAEFRKAEHSTPMGAAGKIDAKPEPNARIDGAVNAVRGETELYSNCFIMPASSVTVTATFGPKYIITINPGEAGGDPVFITSLDDGVWGESYQTADNGQFSPYGVGVDAFNLPDCPFTWKHHTFVNWLVEYGGESTAAPGEAYYAHSYTLTAQWEKDPLADGYYLIGPDWTVDAIDPDNEFEVNPANENEYMLITTLEENSEIKVVHVTNGEIDAWYPDGLDNQYHVDSAHAGLVTIYFQTTYKEDWSAFGGYFWIEAHVHVLTEHEAKAATCTEEGNTAYWSCDGCGRFFSDAEGTTEIEENSWVLEKVPHTPGEPVHEHEVAATYDEEGHYDEVVYCTVCDTELSRETVTIPKLERIAIDGKVEWNAEDVQFKGATAYVIANGSAQTPRFTVINKKDNSVVDPAYYDFEYKENTQAGTGYVFVTFKDMYEGSCRGVFKIYLPATTATTVENTADGIKLTWEPVEGAAGYVIYRRAWSSTTDGWTAFARWDNTTETTYLDGHDASHKVYAGTRYQYGVKAYFARRTDPVTGAEIGGNVNNDSGNFNLGLVGPLKTTVRITTRTLNSVTAGTKQMTVKWGASANFTGYQLQYATNKTFTKNLKTIKITNPKTAQRVIKSLTTGTTYYVRIRSYHEFEGMTYYGGWSNVLNCKVK